MSRDTATDTTHTTEAAGTAGAAGARGADAPADGFRPDVPGPGGTAVPDPRPAAFPGAAPEPHEGREAAALLALTRETVDPELRRAVETLPPAVRRIALYHFGWEEADGTPASGNAGKAIRPALVLAATEALGGVPASAVRAAVAVELTHNFTLLHDDVMDGDTVRRHRPTAWNVFGVPEAILAGDAMAALSPLLLAQDPHPASAEAAGRLAACVIELCEGQYADVSFEGRAAEEITLDACLAMAEAKTGALLGCACAIGALYAGAGAEEVEAMDAFGREAGLAFQLIDDLIGIWGDPLRTGKPAGRDLDVRKKSLPVIAAFASGTPEAAELARLYAAPAGTSVPRERIADLLERAGGRDWAQLSAADRMSRAVHHLARAVPDPGATDGLLALAEFVTRRTY